MFKYEFSIFLTILLVAVSPANLQSTENIPCHRLLSLVLSDVQVFPNNSLFGGGRLYPIGTYWKNETHYFGCPCMITNCIRKCPNEFDSGGIVEYKNKTPIEISIWHNDTEKVINAHDHFEVFVGDTCAPGKLSNDFDSDEDKHRILSNGSLHYYNSKKNRIENVEHFCLYDMGDNITIVVCVQEANGLPPKKFQFTLYPILFLISVFFLALTLLAYTFTNEKNLHNRCMTVHCTCLLIGFLGFALIQLVGERLAMSACCTLALITYYFLLSAFYWLNVMCFDIWFTFSDFKKMTGMLHQSIKKKFTAYCLYAFSFPTFLFIITLSLQLTYPEGSISKDDIMYKLRPGIGRKECWFFPGLPLFIYFNGPISILLALNLYFFISTTIKILRLKRETDMIKDSETRTYNEDQLRFKLYLKLFLVMGLSWVFEIISWVAHMANVNEAVWYFTDSINTLQGVFIFLLCVWFTKTRNVLLQLLLPKRFAQSLLVNEAKKTTSATTKSSTDLETSHTPHKIK